MTEKWKKLYHLLKIIFGFIPEEIAAEGKRMLPGRIRYFSLGEKMNLYNFADKAYVHIPDDNKRLIGELRSTVDELTI